MPQKPKIRQPKGSKTATRPKWARHTLLTAIALACVAGALTACFSALPGPPTDRDVVTGRIVRLTHTDDSETKPTWSPDGSRIAFECFHDGFIREWHEEFYSYAPGDIGEVRNWPIFSIFVPRDICVMNADGSGKINLTNARETYSDPAWSPDGNKIAFVSSWHLLVINADGSGLRHITEDRSEAKDPAWSPDGSKLAFSSYTDNDRSAMYDTHLFVVNADGSNLTQITDIHGYPSEPSWSPDGNHIAFIAVGDLGCGIYVMNLDDMEPKLLYREVNNIELGIRTPIESPEWSPDGESIAFVAQPWNSSISERPNRRELYIINADGTGLTRLTHRAGNDSDPAWSPDGSKLAFVSEFAGNPEIYVMTDFETRYQELTDHAYSDRLPVWSPDGTRIVFVDDRYGDEELYIMNADGSETKPLTDNDDADIRPAWSPDGTRIAFVSDRDGDEELYITNAEGTSIKRLTKNRHPDSSPAWSPDGSQIAYVSLHNGWHTDIFVINDDGTDRVQLTSHDEVATHHYYGAPSWSPDGTRIAFISAHDGQYRRHIMNADGTQQVTADIENCPSYDASQWSPDSTSILFKCRDSHIHIFNPSDATSTKIEACDRTVLSHSWSQDSTHIAVACSHGELHEVNLADGVATPLQFVGGSPGTYWPSWSPDGNTIAFRSDSARYNEIHMRNVEPAPATDSP